VFPLRPYSKVPAVKRWEASATTDRAQIADWWPNDPACAKNIGIACGPAGLVVVDLDEIRGTLSADWVPHGVRHGREVLALLAQWAGESDPADTFTVVTPSGEHRYFLAPPGGQLRSTVGEAGRGLGPAVDVRAWGGAVAAAGSMRLIRSAPRLYRVDPRRPADPVPLPQWLITRLTPPPPVSRPTPRVRGSLLVRGSRLDAYVAAAVRGEITNVTDAVSGTRAITVFKAAAALGGLVGAGVLDEQGAEDALVDAASTHDGVDDWTPGEARRHIRNGIARGHDNPRRLDDLAA
jgi:hypothetical protein